MTPTRLPDPVLITGAGGFIGSHLAELCVERGYAVKALVHYRSDNRWGWLEHSACRDAIDVVSGDIRDFDAVYRAAQGCRSILHLAALIGIPYSYVSPLAYLRTNVEGTYNVLEAARLLDAERVAVTSTSETYGTAQYVPIDEQHPPVGQSPYAASKIAADQLAVSYHRSFGLPVWVVRPFNTYGPRQSARAIVPTVITQLLAGDGVVRLGNLRPTRDLTFVRDVASGMLAIVTCDALLGSATNIGMNREISIGDLAHLVAELMDTAAQVVTDPQRVRPETSEVERLRCDHTRLTRETGWSPDYDLRRGLAETIEFLRDHTALYKPEAYNV